MCWAQVESRSQRGKCGARSKGGELETAAAARAEGTREAEALCEELRRRCAELNAERAQRGALAEHLAAAHLEFRVRLTQPFSQKTLKTLKCISSRKPSDECIIPLQHDSRRYSLRIALLRM